MNNHKKYVREREIKKKVTLARMRREREVCVCACEWEREMIKKKVTHQNRPEVVVSYE